MVLLLLHLWCGLLIKFMRSIINVRRESTISVERDPSTLFIYINFRILLFYLYTIQKFDFDYPCLILSLNCSYSLFL